MPAEVTRRVTMKQTTRRRLSRDQLLEYVRQIAGKSSSLREVDSGVYTISGEVKMQRFGQDQADLLAALIYWRLGEDLRETVEAWKRLLQNDGWDDAAGVRDFEEMINRGTQLLFDVEMRKY
jgi:hypothetical protein